MQSRPDQSPAGLLVASSGANMAGMYPSGDMASDATAAPGLAALLLAAGGGRRFGGAKLLAPLHGRPLLIRALELALGCTAVNRGLWVVTGAHRGAVETVIARYPAVPVHNPAWRQGMATSIAAGVAALPAGADALLLLLADQAALEPVDLERLGAGWLADPSGPVAAAWAGATGAPAIFPRAWWPCLAALEGDQGARALLRREPRLRTVSMPNAAHDVDTAAQLSALSAPEG